MNTSVLARLPANGAPELLFLLLHGVGASAAHMAPLAQALAAEYPQAAVLCIDAPDPFDGVPGGGSGFQWFSVRGVTESNRPERVAATLPRFVAQVRDLQQRFDIDWPRTALAGFSQGAIVALEAVQAEPQLAGRVLAFSGRHASAPMHAPADTTVHIFHGLDDRVMPHASVVDEWLMSIRSRISIPGGTCEFDLPAYYAWQKLEPARRRADLLQWVSSLMPLAEALQVLLGLLRDSGVPHKVVAPAGQYQQSLPQGRVYQLMRVRLTQSELLVPEISGHRLMVSVRLMRQDAEGRLKPSTDDTAFELTLCA